MASSRKDLLNRYAGLGFRHGDLKGAQTAVRLEIQERQEQYEELKKEIQQRPSENNDEFQNSIAKNEKIIKKLEIKISALENQIATLLKGNKKKTI